MTWDWWLFPGTGIQEGGWERERRGVDEPTRVRDPQGGCTGDVPYGMEGEDPGRLYYLEEVKVYGEVPQ